MIAEIFILRTEKRVRQENTGEEAMKRSEGWRGLGSGGVWSRNNKNANDLRPGRHDKGFKRENTNKRGCDQKKSFFFFFKVKTTCVLSFRYLHLRLHLIGRSMQTCK